MKTYSTLFAVSGLAALASAHMEMSDPAPLRSKNNPNAATVDYSMTSPLDKSGSDFPCKGFLSDLGTPAGQAVADWTPGESYSFTITGGAAHNGGSCQASLSLDGGETWTVIHSYIGNCPVSGESSYDFAIPSDTPSGPAVFAWTWFNNVGNREMYMNCASVNIGGAGAGAASVEARAPSDPLSGRPAMFVANTGTGCSTVETKDVEFPEPGPDVTREGGNSAPPSGSCGGGGGGGGGNGGGAPVEGDPGTPPAESSAAAPPPPPSDVPDTPPPASEVPDAPSTTVPGGIFISEPAPEPTPSTLVTVTRSEEPAPQPTGEGALAAGTACDAEGTWNCVGGSQYQRCASGQWSELQAVYPGTTCTPGQSETFAIEAVARDESSGSTYNQVFEAIKRMF